MKKLALLAITVGSLALACAPPTTINITPAGGDGGAGGGDGGGGEAGSETTSSVTDTGEPDPDPTAHDEYVNVVHPSLIQTCGGCHNPTAEVGAPVFLDYDAEVSYLITKSYAGVITEDPQQSILITQPPHTGPALSTAQKPLVANWISMELAEAGNGGGSSSSSSSSSSGGGGAMSLEDMLDSFAACMDYDIWLASGMDKFPQQQTNGEGPCNSCHNQGVGAFWASLDPLENFDQNKKFPYIMRLVTPVYEGSTPVDLAPSNRLVNKGKEPCANPPVCHPKYDLTAANKAALESFVGGTLTKWQAGECGKP